jgi:hypothetical protein
MITTREPSCAFCGNLFHFAKQFHDIPAIHEMPNPLDIGFTERSPATLEKRIPINYSVAANSKSSNHSHQRKLANF